MVEPIYQVKKVSESYGNNTYQAIQDVTNQRTFVERTRQIGIIFFGGMESNEIKRILLSDIGVVSPIMIRSIYAFVPSNNNDEINFYIYTKVEEGVEFRVAQQKFGSEEMPVNFPYGLTLFPDNIIEVQPKQRVSNIRLYCSPVDIIFHTPPI